MLRVCYGDYHGPIEGEQSSIERIASQTIMQGKGVEANMGIIVVEPTFLCGLVASALLSV